MPKILYYLTFLFFYSCIEKNLSLKRISEQMEKSHDQKSCSTAFQSVTASAHQKSDEKMRKGKEYTIKREKKTDKIKILNNVPSF